MPRESPYAVCPGKSTPNWKQEREDIRHRIETSFVPRSFFWRPKACPMTSSRLAWICPARLSANGGSVSLRNASPDWTNSPGAGGQPVFPPCVAVQVKALACELPHRYGLPLSRFTLPEIQREVVRQGIVATISGATLWRWRSQDAIRPWRHRSWIFPRDPNFGEKAAPILDLYEGIWDGAALRATEYVLSADEKTSIQARLRKHPSLPTQQGQPMRVDSAAKPPVLKVVRIPVGSDFSAAGASFFDQGGLAFMIRVVGALPRRFFSPQPASRRAV